MLRIKVSEKRKRFLTIFMAFLFIFFTIAYVSTTPLPKEQFFQFYILGETKMAERYYPNDNPSISLNIPVRWYLSITNLMDSPEYVLVKAKLGNETLEPPNEASATPANLPTLIEFGRILLDNETWEIPFTWKILKVDMRGETTFLSLNINNKTIQVRDVGAKGGYNFRIIIELWTLDKDAKRHVFGWETRGQRRAAWLQMWFNAIIAA